MRVSPKELSEFPCPFETDIDCDKNCDYSKKEVVKTKKQIGIRINKNKEGLVTKNRKQNKER